MTNDKQVKVWTEEFDKKYFHMGTVKLDKNTGKYRVRESSIGNETAERECILMNNWLDIWIAAKRSMTPIELPEPTEQKIYQWFQESTIAHHIEEDGAHIKKRAAFLAQKAIQFAITAAGYSYRVKE